MAGRASDWRPERFPISFWCGPPEPFTTLERYQEIKYAGFTHVQPPCAATTPALNRKILDLCGQVGLKAFIGDSRMPMWITGEANAKARLDAVVAEYGNHPALEGYHITDEPNAGAFPGLAEVVAYLREKDPRRFSYINLFPNYANAEQLGTPTYEEHLRRYMETVRPFVLSYDHYHFTNSGDRPEFFANLAAVRNAALAHETHFWNIVLVTPHFGYRDPTEAELRFEAMQTLAYGGKGLLWFTYWMPSGVDASWRQPMIDGNGQRTPHYYQVRRVNREVAAFGQELLRAASLHTFHVGVTPPGTSPRPTDTPLEVSGSGPTTVGIFRAPSDYMIAFIASMDYRQAQKAEMRPRRMKKAATLERFDSQDGRWNPLPSSPSIGLEFPPSGAALVRWKA